jgi:hypothetical protein
MVDGESGEAAADQVRLAQGLAAADAVALATSDACRCVTIPRIFRGGTMENRIWKIIGFWAMALLLFIATMIIIRWVVGFVTWSTLDSGWAQAIGSVAAIVGAFLLARQQYEKERTADLVRRQNEIADDLDAQLQARALAVRNVVQVATYALETARLGVAHSRHNPAKWEAESFLLKADQLRQVLDSLISPATEYLAVVSALQISQILVLNHADIKNIGGAMTTQLLDRSDKRLEEGNQFLANLIQLQTKLDDMCRSRGLPLEIEDFRPSV